LACRCRAVTKSLVPHVFKYMAVPTGPGRRHRLISTVSAASPLRADRHRSSPSVCLTQVDVTAPASHRSATSLVPPSATVETPSSSHRLPAWVTGPALLRVTGFFELDPSVRTLRRVTVFYPGADHLMPLSPPYRSQPSRCRPSSGVTLPSPFLR
jgi:hypothetical protein